MKLESKAQQWGMLIFLGIIWGSSFIFMKQALKELNFIQVAAWRLTFAGIGLLPLAWGKWRNLSSMQWLWLCLVGMLGSGIPAYLFTLGISQIDSSLAGIINATTPLFTLWVGLVFFGLRFGKWGIGGIVLGLAGATYLILSRNQFEWQGGAIAYAFFPLLGSACYGFSANIIKHKLKELSAIQITALSLQFVAWPSFIGLLIWDSPVSVIQNQNMAVSLLFSALLGLICTAFAVILFNYLIKQTTAIFASSVTYLIPVFALLWGILDGEPVSIHTAIGMGVIFMGLYAIRK
jgi:drug/metabolite transporter (DMT)-like permease